METEHYTIRELAAPWGYVVTRKSDGQQRAIRGAGAIKFSVACGVKTCDASNAVEAACSEVFATTENL